MHPLPNYPLEAGTPPLAEIAAHRHPSHGEQAVLSYRQALTLADERGMRPLQAHCHYGLGRLYSQMGQMEQARTELYVTIEMYRAMEMAFWLTKSEVALAEVDEQS